MSSLFLSNFLRRVRKDGWTQVKLAELLGVTQKHVSRLFNGGTPSIEIVLKLADYFEVSTDEILGRIEQKNDTEINKPNDKENRKLVCENIQKAGRPLLQIGKIPNL